MRCNTSMRQGIQTSLCGCGSQRVPKMALGKRNQKQTLWLLNVEAHQYFLFKHHPHRKRLNIIPKTSKVATTFFGIVSKATSNWPQCPAKRTASPCKVSDRGAPKDGRVPFRVPSQPTKQRSHLTVLFGGTIGIANQSHVCQA